MNVTDEMRAAASAAFRAQCALAEARATHRRLQLELAAAARTVADAHAAYVSACNEQDRQVNAAAGWTT